METMTEEQIVSKWGPIRFWEIQVYKSMVPEKDPYNQRHGRSERGWYGSQTIRCYSREELETKLQQLKLRVPKMTTFTMSKPYPVDMVRIEVWATVRGWSNFRRCGRYNRLKELRPIFSQVWTIA